jgi:NADH-quinone oxidoreductase subunit N
VLQAAVGAGYVWVAVVAVIASVVGAFYYLRIVKLMYFDEPAGETGPVRAQHVGRFVLAANGLFLLVLGIVPQQLMTMCAAAVAAL